jgi:dimethylhistidine N-methyltransferase
MSIAVIDLHPAPTDLKRVVQEGLQRKPRQLPAWLLYDNEGSQLFAAICDQPEYSLTRTEIALLESHAADIASTLGSGVGASVGSGVVVEFGIGNAKKVDPLLRALQPKTFVALDISRSALEHSLTGLAAQHPATQMLGICCDHSQLQDLPRHPWLTGERRIGFFPGSSLGNFTPEDAVLLLQQFRHLLAGGPLLLGLDQPRDPALLEAAYDDAAGMSRAFAFNLLKRLNRDLQGNALPKNFRYQARWQADQQRIEMALVSRCAQTIQLADTAWSFQPNERWVTEHSVKYTPDAAADLAAQAGWQIQQRWQDDQRQMSLHLLVPSN